MSDARLTLLDRAMERYNAGDAEGYAACFTEDGVEASYRGADLRVGRRGVRDGNAKTFSEYPENRAEVLDRKAFGPTVLVHEQVWRTVAGEPFEVMAIYSFREGLIERVEFVR